MKLNEVFVSFQGEGKYAGERAVFIRLAQCNLNCVFCDTDYTVKQLEVDIIKEVVKSKVNRVVITGGEPLLQQQELIKLIGQLPYFVKVTIETNGTIMPVNDLFEKVDHWSISPKLSNSKVDLNKRINYDVLEKFSTHLDYIFKFVISDYKDVLELNKLVEQTGIKNIYLMAEGNTEKQQIERMFQVAQYALKYNYNISPRLQCLLWNGEQGY